MQVNLELPVGRDLDGQSNAVTLTAAVSVRVGDTGGGSRARGHRGSLSARAGERSCLSPRSPGFRALCDIPDDAIAGKLASLEQVVSARSCEPRASPRPHTSGGAIGNRCREQGMTSATKCAELGKIGQGPGLEKRLVTGFFLDMPPNKEQDGMLPDFVEIEGAAPEWGRDHMCAKRRSGKAGHAENSGSIGDDEEASGRALLPAPYFVSSLNVSTPSRAPISVDILRKNPRKAVKEGRDDPDDTQTSAHVPFPFLWAGQRPIYERQSAKALPRPHVEEAR